MPLPAFCTDGLPPCCECLYGTVARLVDAAADAVLDCIADELCKEFARFVSVSRPTGMGDFVAGWVTGGQTTAPGNDKQVVVPKIATTITVRLMESGWPPAVDTAGSRIMQASWDSRNFAAQHFYGHHEAALRAMLNVRRPHCTECGRLQFVSHAPSAPEATFISWEYAFRMVEAP